LGLQAVFHQGVEFGETVEVALSPQLEQRECLRREWQRRHAGSVIVSIHVPKLPQVLQHPLKYSLMCDVVSDRCE
jgi:hypothetical protein